MGEDLVDVVLVGSTRKRKIKMRGSHACTQAGKSARMVFSKRCLVEVTETFGISGSWSIQNWHLDTAIECPYWWTRLWRRLFSEPMIPKMRALEDKNGTP